MSFGVKTNERPGTRAVVRDVRMSARKIRVVLDLIRGLPTDEAHDVLALTERSAAERVGACLDSAIANAEHNDERDPEGLYVSACFADEGRTLYRFRPRARGSASRIRKRTSHITIIVSPMPGEMLERHQARQENIPGSRAARRRGQQEAERRAKRVAASQDHDHDHDDVVEDAEEVDAVDVTEDIAEDVAEVETTGEDPQAEVSDAAEALAEAAASAGADAEGEAEDSDEGADEASSDTAPAEAAASADADAEGEPEDSGDNDGANQ